MKISQSKPPETGSESSENKHKTLVFGRRKGRPLRIGKREALVEGQKFFFASPLLLKDVSEFIKGSIAHLEIGFGDGFQLCERAKLNPNAKFLGAEFFQNGIAAACRFALQYKLDNIRFFNGIAQELMDVIPESSLTSVSLLFPDPWPKTRHQKRRFVQTGTLKKIHDLLRPEGEFIFASDNPEYVNWVLEHILSTSYFRWRHADWRSRPLGWIPTRYEQKKNNHAGEKAYFIFEKTT